MSDNQESASKPETTSTEKKGRPTPARKEREAARKRPLVGDRSKEAKRAAREKLRDERNRARTGMMAGEEKFLTIRDRGPQRRLVRNFVDARFTAGELVLPALFAVVLLTFIDDQAIALYSLFGMWGLFAVVAVDAWVVGRLAKRTVAKKYGVEQMESGLAWYAAMRSIQMRPMRIPKPQVKRGEKVL
jgi:hypothetical protein